MIYGKYRHREENMDLHEEIKKVAYELYEKSGRIGGRENENWLAAEKIVMARYAQKERGIKAAGPAAGRMSQKTTGKLKPKGSEGGKSGTKKATPKTTAKKIK